MVHVSYNNSTVNRVRWRVKKMIYGQNRVWETIWSCVCKIWTGVLWVWFMIWTTPRAEKGHTWTGICLECAIRTNISMYMCVHEHHRLSRAFTLSKRWTWRFHTREEKREQINRRKWDTKRRCGEATISPLRGRRKRWWLTLLFIPLLLHPLLFLIRE